MKLPIKKDFHNDFKAFLKSFAKGTVEVVRLYLSHDLPIFAAGASFFLIIASIPLMMLMVSTISLLPMVDIEDLTNNLNLLFPHVPYITYIVNYTIRIANQLSKSTVVYINILTSIISGSTSLFSFIIGIRKVHNIHHTRNYILIKFMTIINIIVLYFTIIFTIVFFVIGHIVHEYANKYIPIVGSVIARIMEYKYLTAGIIILIFSLSLYFCCAGFRRRYATNVYGALFTAVSWILVANLFSIYFEKSNMTRGVYQSIFGTMLMLIWLYVCVNLIFIGACINEVAYPQKKFGEKKEN